MGVELATDKAGYCEMMEDVNVSDLELVHLVRDALISDPRESDSYGQLVEVLHRKVNLTPDDVALIVTTLKALSGAVSCIDIDRHESLLSAIFGMSMWSYGPDVSDALAELIVSLASSSGKFLVSCLEMLVGHFIPPKNVQDLLKQSRGLARKDRVLSQVHSALKDISDLVPLAPDKLCPIVLGRMPKMSQKEPLIVITVYVESMLRLESGAIGELVGSEMLKELVYRLIELDVEIKWSHILRDDSSKGIFDMELEDVEETADDAENDGGEFAGESSSRTVVAEKLDSLMVLTFEHLKSCAVGGRLVKVFDILVESFRITVLNAYKSKFAQFVMFYACSLDPEKCGVTFAVMLEDIFFSNDPPNTRMSAVAYLASYLSRGKFLSPSLVVSSLKRLVDWCLSYCQAQGGGDINPKSHSVFYSGCQAIMYVLCFRMRSLIDVPRLKSELLLMPIQLILKHPLNPLKVCFPCIVDEFLQQAKAAGLFTESAGTETFIFNEHLLVGSELSRAFGGIERLDMFFPFDPCLLRKCDSYIRPNFIYWSMVRTTYDDDEESSSDEDIDEDFEDVAEYGMEGRSFEEHDLDMDEFDYSMNKMSITPKKSLMQQMPSRLRPSTSPESL